MCATCGCSGERHEHGPHEHEHGHEHGHGHSHRLAPPRPAAHLAAQSGALRLPMAGRELRLEQQVLARNDALAGENRRWLAERGVLALNLISSPGAGKTTLLERTLADLGGRLRFQVVEGDQETEQDAQRIRAAGAQAVQVNTGAGCHLDAAMVRRAMEQLAPPRDSVLFIENVGNLVCPALFDLGERAKVVVASVTEGEDKPIKYPHIFRAGQVLLLNKLDLLPHLRFDVGRFLQYAAQVNPHLTVFQVSATHGDGLDAWYQWLERTRSGLAAQEQATP